MCNLHHYFQLVLATFTPLTRRLLPALLLAGLVLVALAPPGPVYAAGITVNTTADVRANDGQCSLREAIIAANTNAASGASAGECAAGSGADVITLPAGTYTLTIGGTGEQAAATGDLDITANLTINGAGAGATVVNGNSLDRVFEVVGVITVDFNDLTITGGGNNNQSGGGIYANTGTVLVQRSAITGNNGIGGSALRLQGAGTLTILNSTVSNNTDNNNNGAAAVVSSGSGTLNIVNTTLSGNSAPVPSGHGGGAVLVSPFSSGVTRIRNSTFVNNSSVVVTGGVSSYAAVVNIQNSIFHNNTPNSCGRASGGTGSFTGSNNLINNSGLCSGITLAAVTNLDTNLANNGGSTLTHALLSGSNAIDAGTGSCPDHTGSPLTIDQRGISRPYNGVCDIGAFEFLLPPPNLASIDPPGNVYTATVNSAVSVTYDQTMDAATVNPQTFTIHAMHTGQLGQSYSVSGGQISLTPANPFNPGELVQATATTGTLSLGGAAPASPTVWQFWAGVSAGSGLFASTGQSFGPGSPRDVAIGDLDGDGDLDLMAAHGSNNNPERIWLNDGAAQFAEYSGGVVNRETEAIALGDLEGDGDLDVVVAKSSNRFNAVWLNDGAANFTGSGQSLDNGTNTFGVALGDLNGDGSLDIVFANDSGQGNRIWLNNGAGVFANNGQSLGTRESRDVVLGDLDGDGDLDAIFANYGQGNTVWLNDGSGIFTDSTQSLGVANTLGVALGDLDDDGDLDAVFANDSGQGNTVWFNNGAGLFTNSGQSLGTRDSWDVVLGDVNNDGSLDAAFANSNGNAVWFNNGTGTFTDSGQNLGNSVSGALGDLDGDGSLDLAFHGGTAWLNLSPADLSLTKTANPTSAPPGQSIIYTLTFTNNGPDTAVGVVITDSIPISVTNVSVTSSGAVITDTGASPAYVWQVQDLAPGQGGIITITGQISPGLGLGVFTNTAQIASAVADTDTTNNSSSRGITITAPPQADLTVSGLTVSPTSVCRGQGLGVQFTASNLGTGNAGSHKIFYYDDDTPAGFTNKIGQTTLSALVAGSNLPFNVPYNAALAGTRYIKVRIDAEGVIDEALETNNTAVVTLAVAADDPPAGTIAINSGAQYTNNQKVNLALSASDAGGGCSTSVKDMRFAYNSAVTAWEPFATGKSLTILAVDGDKVPVSVQYRDQNNNASIFFSQNIILDTSQPHTGVTSPSGSTANTTLTVRWSGFDVSGLKDYDVQYNDNGGAWVDWQTGTTATSAAFTGSTGHTYCFRSRGEDNAGNVETYPGSGNTCVSVTVPTSGLDLLIENVEFTQATQNSGNNVSLVAGRPALGRVTVGLGATAPITNVTAKLHVFRDGQELPGSPLTAENGPITAKAAPDPNSEADLLQFKLPTSWLNGTLRYYVEVDPDNTIAEADESNNRFPASNFATLNFNTTNNLEITVVPIIWEKDGQTHQVSLTDVISFTAYLKRLYPVADVEIKIHSAYRYVGSSLDWADLLFAVEAIRRSELPSPDFNQKYYGLVPYPLALGGPRGVAFQPGSTALGFAGPETGHQIMARGIGHTFGRSVVGSGDAGCANPAGADSNYPYANGVINYPGWDLGANRIIANTVHDIMSMCGDQWVSDYTYSAIYNDVSHSISPLMALLGRELSMASLSDGLLVTGQITNDGSSGQLNAAFTLNNTQTIDNLSGGEFRVTLVDNSDTEIYVHTFDAPTLSDESLGGAGGDFSFVLPLQPTTSKIRLYYRQTLLDELVPGAPPSVNITSSVPGTLPDTYTLSWSSSPGGLSYFVRFSPDNGATWKTISPPTGATQLEIDVTTLAGTTNGIFEVVASNGFNSASARTASFSVPTKAPVLQITGLQSQQTFGQNETLVLSGLGFDFEDGTLAGNNLTWVSNRDGTLGQGSTLQVSGLSPGQHTITLQSTDSNGQTGQTGVIINITAVSSGSGASVYLPVVVKHN